MKANYSMDWSAPTSEQCKLVRECIPISPDDPVTSRDIAIASGVPIGATLHALTLFGAERCLCGGVPGEWRYRLQNTVEESV